MDKKQAKLPQTMMRSFWRPLKWPPFLPSSRFSSLMVESQELPSCQSERPFGYEINQLSHLEKFGGLRGFFVTSMLWASFWFRWSKEVDAEARPHLASNVSFQCGNARHNWLHDDYPDASLFQGTSLLDTQEQNHIDDEFSNLLSPPEKDYLPPPPPENLLLYNHEQCNKVCAFSICFHILSTQFISLEILSFELQLSFYTFQPSNQQQKTFQQSDQFRISPQTLQAHPLVSQDAPHYYENSSDIIKCTLRLNNHHIKEWWFI